jgi:hypothetical protein
MSAWTVSNAHIDVLVNAAAEYGVLDEDEPREFGQTLWRENYRSVNYRYREAEPTPQYTLTTTEAPLHPVAVLKALDCYEHQACECPDWVDTTAYAFAQRIRSAIYERHPALAKERPCRHYPRTRTEPAYRSDPLYEAFPWGFVSLSEAESQTTQS